MNFSVTDLFMAGLAFDICGAVLLAQELLIAPRMIAALNTWQGLNTGDTVERCRNRSNAGFGVSYLAFGFVLQAGGYGAQLAGVDPGSGACRVYTGIAAMVVASFAAYLLWAVLRTRILKRTIVKVVLAHDGTGNEGDEKRPGWTRNKAGRLLELGEDAGWPARSVEVEEGGQGPLRSARVWYQDPFRSLLQAGELLTAAHAQT